MVLAGGLGGVLELGRCSLEFLAWVSDFFKYYSGWWFGTFFIFPYIGNNLHLLKVIFYFAEG